MKVRIVADGVMKKYLGIEEAIDVELDEGAILEDIFAYIDVHLSPAMPPFLWDKRSRCFRGPVVVSVDQRVAVDMTTPLRDKQEIHLFMVIVGG